MGIVFYGLFSILVVGVCQRTLETFLSIHFSLDSEAFLSEDFLSEINFWASNVDFLNGRVYWWVQSLSLKVSDFDASDSACGAFNQSDSGLVFHLFWGKISGFHLERTRESFAGRLSHSKVIWYSENQNAESIPLFSLSIFRSTFWDVDQDAISDGPIRGWAAWLKSTVLSAKANSLSSIQG